MDIVVQEIVKMSPVEIFMTQDIKGSVQMSVV